MRDLRKIQNAITEMRRRLDESMVRLAHCAVRGGRTYYDSELWAKRAHYQNLAIRRLTDIMITEVFLSGDDLEAREAATASAATARAARAR